MLSLSLRFTLAINIILDTLVSNIALGLKLVSHLGKES
jgi:hypothetical protein